MGRNDQSIWACTYWLVEYAPTTAGGPANQPLSTASWARVSPRNTGVPVHAPESTEVHRIGRQDRRPPCG